MRLPSNWTRLRPLLWPVALLYGALVWWRNFFYQIGFFVTRRVGVPVVSIGNLTVGGTGKTPAVIFLAQHLSLLGYRPGIVSRGYGRHTSGTVLVSDGRKLLATAGAAGDEAFLLASRLPEVPVVVDEDRYRGANLLSAEHDVDVLLLDDGFQHRGLARNCDLLLMDAAAPASDYRMFPYGTLRERLSAVRRASLVVWTRTEYFSPDGALRQKLAAYPAPQITSRMEVATTLKAVGSGEERPSGELAGRPILAFCGVGRPHSFYQKLLELGLEPQRVRYFPDHHSYTRADLEILADLADPPETVLITTEKDAVKLPDDFLTRHQVYSLKIEFTISGADLIKLDEVLLECLSMPRPTAPAGEA